VPISSVTVYLEFFQSSFFEERLVLKCLPSESQTLSRASKSDSAPPRGEAWEPDSLRAQSQRRDVVSMVEMMNIACGETEQSFHLNASTYTTTGNPLLLFLTTRALPCPIRKRLLLTQSHHRFARVPALHHNTTTRTAWSSNHTDRQSL
jgi:hypothetical protein